MKSGFSLLELVVALALLSLVTVVSLNLTRPLGLLSSRSLDRMEMHQESLISFALLRASLQSSAPPGLSLGDRVMAINPRSQPAVDSSGNLHWSDKLDVFYVASDELRQRRWPPAQPVPGDPAVPAFMSGSLRCKRFEGPQLLALGNPASPARRLAQGVQSWKVENLGPDGLIHQPIQVLLILQRHGRKMEFRRSYFLLGAS
ncbi:MAG: prepilin-type N-terminal cleavage/methylation domain-containing protein [Vulcanimicrobiota bacterium]